jgi:hypothetical protein
LLFQQLVVLKRRHPKPRLDPFDKLFWVVARGFWAKGKDALLLVSPETVVRWHRAGFRLYWAMLCKVRRQVGGKRISKQIRDQIFQMVVDNPTWGAPRIHGELLMLGFDVSERTISRWMRRAPRNPEPAKRWLSFLHNHCEDIAAMDFFTVPTVTSTSSIAFSSSAMTGGAFYTSTSPASDQPSDRSAVTRSISLSVRSQVPPLRSRHEVRIGSPRCDPLDDDQLCTDLHSKSLAERSR